MKLLRYGPSGREKPGLIDASGRLRDLSPLVENIAGPALSPANLKKLARIAPEKLRPVRGRPRFGPPVAQVGKLIGIGFNYAIHAERAGMTLPTEPLVFTKATSAIIGPNDDIVIPKGSERTDWEVELALVIGSRASHVTEADALSHIAGYLICNDVSERSYQFDRGGAYDKGKGCDTFAPLGPWLVTREEIPDPQALDLWLDVNGERMQTGHSRDMVFGVATIVSYVSRFMTLWPGDIITTGTPPGAGFGQKPQRFLKAGDVVRLGISGLGEQELRCIAFDARPHASRAAHRSPDRA